MSARRAPLGILALALATAACTAGPTYAPPTHGAAQAPGASGAFLNASDPALASTPPPDQWWRLYADDRLDGYVREALAANTDLRVADANLRRAAAAILEAESARTVTTSLFASLAQTRQGGIDSTSAPGAGYALGGGVSYPLDLAGGIRRTIELTRANAEAVQAERDQVRVVTAAAVTGDYVAVCSANRSIAAAQHVVEVETRTLDDVQRLFRGGRDTAFDVTRARTAVDQSAAAIAPLLAQRQSSLYALAALMGRPVSEYPRDLQKCAEPPVLTSALPTGNGAALIRRRSDVRSAERSLAAATAGIGVQTALLYPQVSIGGAAGFAGPFSAFGSASSFGGNIGPLLSWTFPNLSATRARIAEAGAVANAAAAQFDGAVLGALRQAETALEVYVREIEHNRSLRNARSDASRASAQATRLFRFGRTDVLALLTVEATLAASETALAASDAALANDQVQVFLALGGGWRT